MFFCNLYGIYEFILVLLYYWFNWLRWPKLRIPNKIIIQIFIIKILFKDLKTLSKYLFKSVNYETTKLNSE